MRLRKKHGTGQALPEYALVIALITLASVAVITSFGKDLEQSLNTMAQKIYNADTGK